MALLTQKWGSLREHRWVIAAMWLMAQGTRFGNRRMLPKVGATFLCMTGITGVINIVVGEQEVVVSVMDIMAIAACHLAKAQWVT